MRVPYVCGVVCLLAIAGASLARPPVASAEARSIDCGATAGYPHDAIWAGWRGCPTGLGLSERVGARDKTLQWNASASQNAAWPTQVGASPVVTADGTIYVGTAEGYLKEITPTGAVKRGVSLGGNIRSAAALGADGTIYVVADAGGLYALNPTTLVPKWTYPFVLPGTISYSAPVIAPDGTVYFADYAGFLYAVNPSGSAKWPTQSLIGPVLASPVLSRDGKTLYIGNQALTFRAINAQTGALVWAQLQITGDTATAAVGDDGTVYVASSKGIVSALNPSNGVPYWNYPTLSVIHASPALDPKGNVIVADVYGTVFSISSAGKFNWARALLSATSSSPTVDRGGTIYIGTGGLFRFSLGLVGNIVPGTKALQALDSSGSVLWIAPTGAGVASTPVISRAGTIYVGADDGLLYAVGTPRRCPNCC